MTAGYCPHCMTPASGDRCPYCGGDLSWTGKKGIDLPVGTVLTGGDGRRAYQIGAARGMGGFGITYIALELKSNKRTAVKEYFPTRCAIRGGDGISVQTATGQEDLFRGGMNSFLKEGKMLQAQNDLPSVVRVLDYFQANGTAYLVMEYLDGVPLHAKMTRMGGRIPAEELMPRLAPLMRDIGQLHRRDIIHRDISPDNIMWMPDGGLKLLDFGSARSMENGKSMTVLMKQGFSPIEQYRSKGQGPYTDIYALAATICYCVTGTIPPSAVERLDDDPLQSPAALGAALTVDQETALLWALSVQPKARPQSMEEFAGMLFREEPKPRPAALYNAPKPKPEPEPVPVQPAPPRPAPGPTPQPTPGPAPWPKPQVTGGKTYAVIFLVVALAIYAIAAWQYGQDSDSFGYYNESTIFLLLAVSAAACAICSALMLKLEQKWPLYLAAIISIAIGPVVVVFAAITDYYSEAVSLVALPAAAVAAVILRLYWREYWSTQSGNSANGSTWPR